EKTHLVLTPEHKTLFGLAHVCNTPSRENCIAYGKALINIASADGFLGDEELNWVLGYIAAIGATADVIENIKAYKANSEQFDDIFKNVQATTSSKTGLIYDGFKAASADNVLHEKEKEAISKLADKFGLKPNVIEQIEQIFRDEQQLKQKRIQLLFPDGYPDFTKYKTRTACADSEKAELFADFFKQEVYKAKEDDVPFHYHVTNTVQTKINNVLKQKNIETPEITANVVFKTVEKHVTRTRQRTQQVSQKLHTVTRSLSNKAVHQQHISWLQVYQPSQLYWQSDGEDHEGPIDADFGSRMYPSTPSS
ncbi:unnamed protein product, partial [Didymodactylos carnosus]